MVEVFSILAFSFFFSFIGSIPPGVVNLSVLELSLRGQKAAAYRFAVAAALVEYPYAYIAIRFEALISSNPLIADNFHLLAAVVMLLLGTLGLWQARRPSASLQRFNDSGFRKGVIVSILNPLAIPFWIGVTAFLRNEGWVQLTKETDRHYYVIGVSLGTLCLLVLVARVSAVVGERFGQHPMVRKVPAFVFLALGFYSLVRLVW
ncbi:MAG: LysE family transporter [Cyclobacteriaceae bacterium]|nr:LysE family transporter [Cyclobacteriaceae bacterium]